MDNKKILIVDDDDNMREAMRETIKRMNVAEVDTAVNGRDGYAKATSAIYDLIISDMRMPDIDGFTMFEMLKVTGIGAPVCFVTAFGTVAGAVEALKEGAYDYILKPFSPEVIEELVRRTFELKSADALKPVEKRGAIYKSAYMAHVFSLARDVARSEATVLITGESGTGKEVLARFIHENSIHSSGPFVAINCAAIPDNLLESELFGYEKGAFTGAANRKIGKFEIASGGTILLDEVGEIPLHLQPKLLRVLQEKEIERLGSEKTQKINTRILATTNRELRTMANEGSFREDLFYRLNVISMELPPLRDRKEDLPELVNFFVKKYSEINHKPFRDLSEDALNVLTEYAWPGNVRELEHTMERATVLARGKKIEAADLFLHGITVDSFRKRQAEPLAEQDDDTVKNTYGGGGNNNKDSGETNLRTDSDSPSVFNMGAGLTIADMERELILNTLRKVEWNRTRAAEMLGITVRTLRNKLNEYREAGINIEELL
ncbi:MAG: sigma-54 dependent transcriptional regulator [Deferribacteraceae bacterium]|jgi:two-component system response regulator FlrC|nr:sigma-54 dependent transcriptional regulator [Deferribacteraceae bacterium]